MIFKTSMAAAVVLAVAGCGGDSGSDSAELAQQAAAKKAQAESLAASGPCSGVQQCGVLAMSVPARGCLEASFRVYSLVSPTAAAASAAAAEEVSLAEQSAGAYLPPMACAQVIQLPPTPACVANSCQAQ